MIDGVQIMSLRTILDDRGMVRHMMKSTDPHSHGFGEIYFSVIFPGAIKAWHLHKKLELNYAVISGNIKMVLHDRRKGSPTWGEIQEIFMGEDNYVLLKVPPGVVNGFTAVGNEKAMVANCATIPHDPEEIERIDPFDPAIGYPWGLRNFFQRDLVHEQPQDLLAIFAQAKEMLLKDLVFLVFNISRVRVHWLLQIIQVLQCQKV